MSVNAPALSLREAVDVTYGGSAGTLVESLVRNRTELTISKAVNSFRSKTLTPEQALAAIAQVSDLRLLLDDLAARFRAE